MLARPVAIPVAMVPGRTHSLGAMSKLRPANQSSPSRRRGPKPDRRRALELLAVLLGRLHGVPTPVNETVRRLANRAALTGSAPGSMTPAEIVEAVEAASVR